MSATTEPTPTLPRDAARADALRGFFFALGAFLLWGIQPLFMKAMAHIPPDEVVAHRVIWSLPLAAIAVLWIGKGGEVRAALGRPRLLATALASGLLITLNWTTYVWAIAADRALETALGYYINPLVNVAIGALLLGERLTRPQLFALAMAILAVSILTAETGGLPWVSIVLALTFAVYGYVRKTMPLGAVQGFLLEIMILSIPALAYVGWLIAHGRSHFVPSHPGDIGLLLLCGPITAIPLMLFSAGARLLRYSTIGLMQYIGPTIVFFIAVFLFGEPFSTVHAIAFSLIWIGLAIYTWSALRVSRAG